MTRQLRWWRVAVLLERSGEPWTWTFHVRAFTDGRARRLVADRLQGEAHAVFVCHPSDPLNGVEPREAIAADYGPYRRSWADPTLAELLPLRGTLA
jgi:hypothetical protein